MPVYPNQSSSPRELSQDSHFAPRTVPQPSFSVWDRFRGKGRLRVSWTQSLIAILRSSYLNVLLAFVPVAWGVHFVGTVSHTVQFGSCFIALIPLSKLLDYGGENLALYCRKDIGDLIIVTLNNAIQAILSIVLLAHCQLKLVQSTIVGVILLRLLLVPACALITGGARIAAQELHPHLATLNEALLTIGLLAILLPATFFAALNSSNSGGGGAVSDDVRGDILKVSRGLAVILLAMYLCSRVFLHNPPNQSEGIHERKEAPAELKEMVQKMAEEDLEVNPWACLVLLVFTVALVAVIAQFLVESTESMQERHQLKEEWFGLFMLPFISFSAECIISAVYFVHFYLQQYLGPGTSLSPPKTLAKARSVDLSIQFLIFWMPLLVLLAWCSHRPLSLLFDLFEVVALIGATFLVNNVTADAKTSAMTMLALYFMIALTAWFYSGQPAIATMAACVSIHDSLAAEGVPPGSTFTNISFGGFHATLDESQVSNFTEHLLNLKKLYDVLLLVEQSP
ncbi:hypothetical protein GGX14DRAFT_344883 [Mycena pura]|uniref:Sodium/calcium exchanger membrane region domain-containing protein n=1 Tax=Mycena pura TaxID=153505 RepID=A0AAD7E521_9AGAR|nr:hypothetical protein GGX14DRAFT_344883 [Mycena pura]